MKLKRPTVHRVHEKPDPSRLNDYREEVLSHNVPCGNLEKPAEVQKLLRRLGTLAIGPALKIGFLKSLMRARYAVEALGHYGLAKAKYAHFTSPIRRYADLVVHRGLFEDGGHEKAALKDVADHISATERNSADAERDSKSVKLYAYLQAQLKSGRPHKYPALVTDIRNFGFFVDVPDLGMSGLVPLSLLTDDFYEFDAERVEVRGRRRRRTYRLGDQVEVVVAKVDTAKKQVDFTLASASGTATRGRRGTSGKSAKSGKSGQQKSNPKRSTPDRGTTRRKTKTKSAKGRSGSSTRKQADSARKQNGSPQKQGDSSQKQGNSPRKRRRRRQAPASSRRR